MHQQTELSPSTGKHLHPYLLKDCCVLTACKFHFPNQVLVLLPLLKVNSELQRLILLFHTSSSQAF